MEVEDDETTEVLPETPEISIHAIYRARTPQTMKVHGQVGKHQITLLIDSGSTHNFLDTKIARKLGVMFNSTGNFEVAVAKGEKIPSSGRCKGICTIIQDRPVTADYYLLPLVGCNAILGAQWLRKFGSIIWDFSKLQMKFHSKGKDVVLTSLAAPANKIVGENEINKELKTRKEEAFCRFTLSLSLYRNLKVTSHILLNWK